MTKVTPQDTQNVNVKEILAVKHMLEDCIAQIGSIRLGVNPLFKLDIREANHYLRRALSFVDGMVRACQEKEGGNDS